MLSTIYLIYNIIFLLKLIFILLLHDHYSFSLAKCSDATPNLVNDLGCKIFCSQLLVVICKPMRLLIMVLNVKQEKLHSQIIVFTVIRILFLTDR